MTESTPAGTPPATPGTTPPAPGATPPAPGATPPDPGATPPIKTEPGTPPAVPEKYDIKFPDGSLFDPSAAERIGTFARDLGLSQEGAQKLATRDSEMLSEAAAFFEQVQKDAHTELVAEWKQAVKTDKDLGGDKYAETEFLAAKAMKNFATPAFRQMLEETGYGNHPEVMRFFVSIGRALSEDGLVTKDTSTQPGQRDAADVLYGKP